MSDTRFIADCMLGKLAKWLKILGFDTEYHRAISDDELIERSLKDDRILLTRDTKLVRRKKLKKYILIDSEVPMEQVKQVLDNRKIRLDDSNLLSRCLICNVRTEPIDREAVRDLVPPYVIKMLKRFSRCPECERIYWGATHTDSILHKLREKLKVFLIAAMFLFFLCPASAGDDRAYTKNLRYARMHADSKEWDNAIEFYKRALEANPQGIEAFKELIALQMFYKQDTSSACALAAELKAIIPEDSAVRSLSQFCAKLSSRQTATDGPAIPKIPEDILKQDTAVPSFSLERELEKVGLYMDAETLLYEKKDYEAALRSVEKALSMDPDDISLLILKAATYIELNQTSDAQETIQKVEELGIDVILSPLLALRLSSVYDGLGNARRALSLLEKAGQMTFKESIVIPLIDFCEKHKDMPEAKKFLDSFVKSCNSCADPIMQSAHAAAQSGDLHRAVKLLDYATLSTPSDYSIFFWLGHYHIQLNDLDGAIKNYEKGLTLNEGDFNVYHNLGYAYYRKDEYLKSARSYEKVIELNPEYAEAYLSIGKAYVGVKNWAKAETAFKRALHLDPSLYQAYYNLSIVAREKGDHRAEMFYLQTFYDMKARYSKPASNGEQ